MHSNAWFDFDEEEYCVFFEGPWFALEPKELSKENNYSNMWGGLDAEKGLPVAGRSPHSRPPDRYLFPKLLFPNSPTHNFFSKLRDRN